MLDYYTEYIMWCENRECDVMDCFRNPKHIRPFTFRPLSFAPLENTEFCYKERSKTMLEIKPCPFCGSTDVELRAGALFNGAVHCNTCTADVVFDAVRMIAQGDYDWETAVIDGWNRRAENA